ncbi:MAG: NAD(P)H-hydrate dehydratase [Tissierellaceae bacterium]
MDSLLPKRKSNSHKGTYGRVGIISGSRGMTGAPYLSSQAALRIGAGLVYTIIPEYLETIMCIKLTEAIVKPILDEGKGHFIRKSSIEVLEGIKNMDTIAIGPGIGLDEERIDFVSQIVKSCKVPMVIDADGINCISHNPDILLDKKNDIIITPHPGEMARLVRSSTKEIQENREYYAKYAAEKYNIYVVLKGNNTIVTSPKGEVYINKTGNPGMATAGSGDVLTGMITGLLGQDFDIFNAAKLGVYLHGKAGDLACESKGEYSVISTDILENIAYSMKEV